MLHTNDKIVKHKVGLLNLADELGNILKACKMMGVSRDTFYRYKEAVNDGGVESLLDQNRRVPNHKNRVDPTIESAVVAYAVEEPAHGQVRVSNELRKRGVFVSPSGVRSIWLRHDLANFKQRLKAFVDIGPYPPQIPRSACGQSKPDHRTGAGVYPAALPD
jgi:transposase